MWLTLNFTINNIIIVLQGKIQRDREEKLAKRITDQQDIQTRTINKYREHQDSFSAPGREGV